VLANAVNALYNHFVVPAVYRQNSTALTLVATRDHFD
jgi:hypothetical protein